MSRTRRCVLIAVATVGTIAPGARAATWTQIPSNTTEEITAIEYQGPDRLWFATASGHIFKRVGDGFVQKAAAPGVAFRDIEFQDNGPVGFAVGSNGGVLRSADNGDSWTAVGAIAGGRQTDVNNCVAADQPIGDVDSIRFAGSARAWLLAGGTQIYRTVDGATDVDVGSAATGWQFVNNNGGACRIPKDVDDVFAAPGSSSAYFASKDAGAVFESSDALATPATLKPAAAGSGVAGRRRLAGDPANPRRQWAIASGGAGASFVARTTDGWSTAADWTIANPDRGSITTPAGVDFNGGTVAAVGSAGMIVESVDGATFYLDPARGAAATQDWRSVSLASPALGAVGGTGGALAVSADANVVPATPLGPPAPVGGSGPASSRPPAALFPPPRRRPLPVFGFAARSKPPVAGGSATRRGAFVILRVLGLLKPPRGLTAAAACTGTVVLTVSRTSGRRRDLTDAATRLSRVCTYAKLLRVRRTRLGKRSSLRLRVAFKGNAVVGASSVTYTVPVR